MVTQAFGFDGLAPNIIVKFPTTAAGLAAMEEASYRGISVNATVSFSVAQAVAAAEAVQRGIDRREADGHDTSRMGPVITIMMGRIEDWLRVVLDRDGLVVDPAALPWSGVAVFKRAYAEWQSRRLPRAAARGGHPAPSALVGAHRRRRDHHHAVVVAEALQRVVDRGPPAHRRSGAVRRRAGAALPRFPARLRAGRPRGRRVRHLGTDSPHVARLHRLLPRPAALVSEALLPNPDK